MCILENTCNVVVLQALGLRRDDAFSTTMLGNVIEALMNEVPPIGKTFTTDERGASHR